MTALRILLGVLILSLVAGTPGLGLETRTSASPLVGALYFIPFAGAIAALVGTWRWPNSVRWLAWVTGISATVLAGADLLGLTDPERPGAGVAATEVLTILAAIGILAMAGRRPMETPDR